MRQQTVLRIYSIALLLTIVMLIAFIFLNHHFDGSVWNGMQISKSALIVEYCELNQTNRFFHQTINTYSNLAYFFLGIIAMLTTTYDKKNKEISNKNSIQTFPLISFLFGCCLVYLCFGSAFFHASLTWTGQRVDMNGTYSICITLAGISLYRLFAKKDASKGFKRIYVFILLLIIIGFIELHLLINSMILLPVLILLIIIATIINYLRNRDKFKMQLALLSLILIIVAGILRTLDISKIGCHPTSIYQGHALWHIFTGMSAFLLYWFYRSERVAS